MPAEVHLLLSQPLLPLTGAPPDCAEEVKPINCRKSKKIMETYNHSFKLNIDLSELVTLNQQFHAFGKATELSEKYIFEIIICLDELFTNIVFFGPEDNLEHTIFFTFALIDDVLTIKVEDKGIPYNPFEVKNPEKVNDLNSTQIGGLGLYIVKELMDEICYKRYRGKNKLTLKKFIRTDKSD